MGYTPMIKGGIWKNTEDEILKAAVSKYGKNQWARISSLLVRKSPKQCKARWYEWLDPSIKKTEWTKDEDEKLLHLAKLMPTQWRTIAPIVGRTPAQCLERYQRLLDEAEQSLGKDALGLTGQMGGESGPSADDVRRLRPGEVDPEPETKPARPDPVDMDEDEKEMLSEARARLANTQGKKAKRKARERQLEEARRLTALQKRRELKAAGINVRMKKLKNTMDYNTDIPFEKRAPKGFYDVTEEKAAKPNAELLTNVRLSKLNRRRADIEEEKERERKRKERDGGAGGNKSEGNQGRFVPAKEQARQVKIQEQDQIAKRRKLVLPVPQVGEQELEEIVKSGFAGESAKNLVHAADDEQQATSGLLGDYAVTPSANATRTPRVAQQKDTLLNEAMNLRALTATQTPLLGGDNVDLLGSQGTGFEGITPRSMTVATPNPMATPMRGGQGGASGAPGAQTPFKTPMRDHFNINDEPEMVGATPRDERMAAVQRKRNLLQGLASLPTPRNEWEIRLPDMDEKDEKDDVAVDSGTSQSLEDMAEVERREKERAAAEEEERLGRRSLAVQLGLPRPASIPQSIEKVHQHLDEVQTLIHAEFVRLLQHDAIKYPVTGSTIAPGAKKMANDLQGLEDEFDRASLDDARNELDLEVKQMLNLDANDTKDSVKMAVWQHVQAVPGYEDRWNAEHDDLFFSSNLKQFMTLDELPDAKDKINGLQKMIESNRQTMIRDATKAGKLEKKLDVRLGGYMARSGALTQQIADAFEELESAQLEYNSFLTLQVIERAATPRRIAALEDEVHRLAQTERELQQKYRDLDLEKTTHLEALS